MTLQPDRLPTRFTHHVWYDQPGGHGSVALAVCGLMMARRDSVVDPTCPVCQAILAQHDDRRLPLVESSS